MPSETCTVRPGEELNVAALSTWLRQNMPGVEGSVQIQQFPHGHSNLVYLVRVGDREYVLRRPPTGPVPPKAHDMAREFRVLRAVHPHFPEAPQVLALCEDTAVAGSPFFLMERRHGIVLRDAVPAEWHPIPAYPKLVSEAFIDCLVRLHEVDIAAPDLRTLGRPEGFVERQVEGWAERWRHAKTEDMTQMDRVVDWLRERRPKSPSPTLVHNDFKLDNVMLAPSADRVEAVLDWEMTTLGDPLADLGLTLCYWTCSSTEAGTTPVITNQPGWYTRDEFVERYARRTGRDVAHLAYYEVLGIFKLAVILQQIYFRFHRGQTSDARFRHFDDRVRILAARAGEMVALYGRAKL